MKQWDCSSFQGFDVFFPYRNTETCFFFLHLAEVVSAFERLLGASASPAFEDGLKS